MPRLGSDGRARCLPENKRQLTSRLTSEFVSQTLDSFHQGRLTTAEASGLLLVSLARLFRLRLTRLRSGARFTMRGLRRRSPLYLACGGPELPCRLPASPAASKLPTRCRPTRFPLPASPSTEIANPSRPTHANSLGVGHLRNHRHHLAPFRALPSLASPSWPSDGTLHRRPGPFRLPVLNR